MQYKLSIIILNWNVRDFLLDTLASIQHTRGNLDLETIVVDNASTDDSVESVKVYYPDSKLIINESNFGFAKANNIAIRQCKGEYILLLNPDTRIIGNCLDVLINYLDVHPEVDMVGPMLVSPQGQPLFQSARRSRTIVSGLLLDILYLGRIPWIGVRLMKWLRYPYDFRKANNVEVISGAAMMFRSSLNMSTGFLSERYFMAGEDIEWCDRIRKTGKEIVYIPEARIIHYSQSCTPLDPVVITINRQMSVAMYYMDKYGKWGSTIYKAMMMFIVVPKLYLASFFYHMIGKTTESVFRAQVAKGLINWRFVGDASYLNKVVF